MVHQFFLVGYGRQLIKLTDLNLNIRVLSTGELDELGIQIVVPNSKAHNEMGRVECRIKLLEGSDAEDCCLAGNQY